MADKLNTSDNLITIGKEALEGQVAEGDDFVPTLIVEHPDGTYDVMVLIGGHPFDMMTVIVPVLREAHPASLGLTVDSYMLQGSADSDMMARRARYGGSLQAMFEAGEPGVSECLIINIISPTSTEVIQLPYKRHDGGMASRPTVTWGDTTPLDGAQFSGRLVDVMRSVWS
jgi:hypothetical protein